jgi:hypothetical protein
LIQYFREEIPKAFEGEDYSNKRELIVKDFDKKRAEIQEGVNLKAKEASFSIEVTPQGIAIIPLVGGKQLSDSEVSELPDEAREDLKQRREGVEQLLKEGLKQIRAQQRQTQEQLRKLDRQVALFVVSDQIDDIIEQYQKFPDVVIFLKAVRQDIQENIETFRKKSEGPEAANTPTSVGPWQEEFPFRKYQALWPHRKRGPVRCSAHRFPDDQSGLAALRQWRLPGVAD